MWPRFLLCLTLTWSASCSCPSVGRNAVFVTLKDARTNAAVCDARVIVADGSFREELPAFACSYSGPTNRAGTYSVAIEHANYRAKVVSGIEVEKDGCGAVEPKKIEVSLDPL